MKGRLDISVTTQDADDLDALNRDTVENHIVSVREASDGRSKLISLPAHLGRVGEKQAFLSELSKKPVSRLAVVPGDV